MFQDYFVLVFCLSGRLTQGLLYFCRCILFPENPHILFEPRVKIKQVKHVGLKCRSLEDVQ